MHPSGIEALPARRGVQGTGFRFRAPGSRVYPDARRYYFFCSFDQSPNRDVPNPDRNYVHWRV